MIQELGFSAADRLVIINADDLGVTHSTNQAIEKMFLSNVITSTSIMIPADAANEATLRCKGTKSMNVGIHITLTSHRKRYYKPIYKKKKLTSLTNQQGFFYDEVSDFEKKCRFRRSENRSGGPDSSGNLIRDRTYSFG